VTADVESGASEIAAAATISLAVLQPRHLRAIVLLRSVFILFLLAVPRSMAIHLTATEMTTSGHDRNRQPTDRRRFGTLDACPRPTRS
jgi:hypothetical protein